MGTVCTSSLYGLHTFFDTGKIATCFYAYLSSRDISIVSQMIPHIQPKHGDVSWTSGEIKLSALQMYSIAFVGSSLNSECVI